MPIEMPKGLPFSVDTWTPCSKRKRHHFLTHAHKDHSKGIFTHSSFPIYATRTTKTLTLSYYPNLDESLFVDIEIGQPIAIDDPVETFTVTAFDANHCPGAVMFLFEGTFGNILHTGDCRLTPECLQSLPEKYLGKLSREPKCRLDYVFLDCTFGTFSSKMPSKHVAIRQVIDCIWKHPDARVVYLTCDLLGQEEILVSVSQTFGSKIFIDKEINPECFQVLSLTVPDILSQDPSSRFHIFDGSPRLPERAEAKLAKARANFQPDPLIIRPSAQWYVFEDVSTAFEKRKNSQFKEAIRDQFGIWHVCYSMHSSRDELEWALQLLAPRWVVSTTPECRAMELSYVKRHCSYDSLAPDDPLWKLLDIDLEAPVIIENNYKDVSIVPSPFLGYQVELSQEFVSNKVTLTVSSQVKESSLTLFGRARCGLDNSTYVYEDLVKPEISYLNEDVEVQRNNKMGTDRDASEDQHDESKSNKLTEGIVKHTNSSYVYEDLVKPEISYLNEDVEVQQNNKMGTDRDAHEDQHDESKSNKVTEGIVKHTTAYSQSESSKGVGENIRKLYRSMHIPVPRPLPSLVDRLNDIKGTKRRRFMS